MAVYGSLRTMPLSDVLEWVKNTNRAGVLTVNRDGGEWELLVEGRTVTSYDGPELRDNLGHIVVTSGLLTEEDLRTALQVQRARGGSLQRALLDEKLVQPEMLEACLLELATESIFDLFIDLPGDFVFSLRDEQGLDLELDDEGERLHLDLDVNMLLMEGARRQDDWQRVRDRFSSDDVEVRIVDDRVPPMETLGVRERRILASVAAGQSVTDICFELRAPILSVLRTLVSFEEKGAVTIRESAAAKAGGEGGRLEELLRQARILREAQQYDEAISLLEVAVRMRPDSEDARAVLREALEEQIKHLYATLPPLKVPVAIASEERLQRMRLRPEERFLLQRLEAHMDIGSLIMVSSANERETLKMLRKMLHSGIITLD